MPYVRIDYTANLVGFPSARVLRDVNEILAASPAIRDECDLKSTVNALSDYRIGTKQEGRAFVYAQCYLFPGRSQETRIDLTNRISSVLNQHVPRLAGLRILISVEMIEMNRDTYSLNVIEG